jgi:hypothetical protein
MRDYPDRETLLDEAINRTGGPLTDQGIDVLLHTFLGVLSDMELQTARKIRDEIVNRFGGRYCSEKTCSMMAELINGHLAVRQDRAGV